MASAIVVIKMMPESPDVDLDRVSAEAVKIISAFTQEDAAQIKVEKEPVAFGLVALKLAFVVDEEKGLPDSLTDDLAAIEGANSADVIDFRRALG